MRVSDFSSSWCTPFYTDLICVEYLFLVLHLRLFDQRPFLNALKESICLLRFLSLQSSCLVVFVNFSKRITDLMLVSPEESTLCRGLQFCT